MTGELFRPIFVGGAAAAVREVTEGSQVYPDRMQENLDRSCGLVFSQPVLLALVSSGLTRDAAYRVVQEAAATAWVERRPFRSVLEADDRVTLSAKQLDDAFGLERSLRHTGGIFAALEEVEP